jgi:hypothetical protein
MEYIKNNSTKSLKEVIKKFYKKWKITISPQSTKKKSCRTNPTSNPNNSIV